MKETNRWYLHLQRMQRWQQTFCPFRLQPRLLCDERSMPSPFASPFCLCPQHITHHKQPSANHSVFGLDFVNNQTANTLSQAAKSMKKCVWVELHTTYAGEWWIGCIWETVWLMVDWYLMKWKQRTLSPYLLMAGKILSPKCTRPVEVYACSNAVGTKYQFPSHFPILKL